MSSSPTEAASATSVVDVTMPQMGVSVAEGTVVAWRVGVGDQIEADATICEISTDKIDTEVPSPATGVVTEILVPVDATVEVGTVLARIAAAGAVGPAASDGVGPSAQDAMPAADAAAGEAGAAWDAGDAAARGAGPSPGAEGAGPSPGAEGAGLAPAGSPPPGPGPSSSSHTNAPNSGVSSNGGGAAPNGARHSPVVQRIAAEHGVDLSQVAGTGRGGRVRKQDVLAFIESGSPAEAPLHIESPYRPDPVPARAPARVAAPAGGPGEPGAPGQLSRMRRQIGEHMKRSLETAATCTTWIEVDMSRVEAARARVKVTALSFVARACIDAIREYPALNAWMEGDRYTRHDDVNLGIAVSLGDDGLIVPIIHRAHELSVEGVAARVRDLARRARSRQLTPDDVREGTFTITNPGQYGSIMATPIINQPQVAILDLEAVVKRPVVVTDAEGNDSIAIRPMTILGLSWDHRALDGALAAQFLAAVKRHLEGLTVS